MCDIPFRRDFNQRVFPNRKITELRPSVLIREEGILPVSGKDPVRPVLYRYGPDRLPACVGQLKFHAGKRLTGKRVGLFDDQNRRFVGDVGRSRHNAVVIHRKGEGFRIERVAAGRRCFGVGIGSAFQFR